MAGADIQAALHAWRSLLGPEAVLDGPAAWAAYGEDTNGIRRRLAGALRITAAGQLPAVLATARRHGVPLYPISTGRNWGYGTALPPRDDCAIVDLSRLNRILHIDATLGTVTVEPGVTQGQLAEFLAARGHPFLVPVTGAGPWGSLVGNALERGYGLTPFTDHFGAVTELEAVLADGTPFRSVLREAGAEALARVSRWGLGPAVNGLFSQSAFGIVTRATLRLARRPPCCQIGLFQLPDDARLGPAIERVRELLAHLSGIVGGINLMNRHRVLAMTAPYPAAQVGPDGVLPAALIAALGREHHVPPWTGFVTLYGTRRTVAAARAELRAGLRGIAHRLLFFSGPGVQRLQAVARWVPGRAGQRLQPMLQTLRSATELVAGRPNRTALRLAYWRHPAGSAAERSGDPARDGCGLIWYAPKLPLLGAEAEAAAALVRATTPRHGIEPLITFTAADTHTLDCTVPLLFARHDAAAVAAAQACYQSLFEQGRQRGYLPYRLGSDQFGLLDAALAGRAEWLHTLRRAFDPQDLIAPGRYAWPADRPDPGPLRRPGRAATRA
ncbi:FAD-binding oxidoreductase [Aquabacterium sp.]|uniref:FAD-binding oxidoreductase n=1 Tax=Aquabacterium sp. TaxID=1872578 RepID=UPI003785088A